MDQAGLAVAQTGARQQLASAPVPTAPFLASPLFRAALEGLRCQQDPEASRKHRAQLRSQGQGKGLRVGFAQVESVVSMLLCQPDCTYTTGSPCHTYTGRASACSS